MLLGSRRDRLAEIGIYHALHAAHGKASAATDRDEFHLVVPTAEEAAEIFSACGDQRNEAMAHVDVRNISWEFDASRGLLKEHCGGPEGWSHSVAVSVCCACMRHGHR